MAADPCLLLSLKEQNDVSIMAEVSDPGMECYLFQRGPEVC